MDKTNPLLAMISQLNAEVVNATVTKKEPSVTTIPSTPETPPPKPPSSQKTTTSKSKQKAGERDWERFLFVCSKDIIHKVHDISEIEGSIIRDIMELFLQCGIDGYEILQGSVKPRNKKGIDSILKQTNKMAKPLTKAQASEIVRKDCRQIPTIYATKFVLDGDTWGNYKTKIYPSLFYL